MSKEQRGTILLAFTALIWGIGFVAQRAAMDYMEPLTFNAVRFGLGGLSLLPVVFIIEGKINWPSIKAGLVGGTVVFVAVGLQQYGIAITGSASIAGFITGLYIVFVPILGMLVGRKTTRFVWIGAAVATVGLYLIGVPRGLNNLDIGSVMLLACAVGWAVHILAVDRFAGQAKPLGFSAVQCLVCAAFSAVAAFMFEDVQVSFIVAGYIPVLYASFVSVLIAFTLQIFGQRHVPPGRSAIIFSMESVIGAIGEALLLGAFLDSRGYTGGGLIFAGILISQIRRGNKDNA